MKTTHIRLCFLVRLLLLGLVLHAVPAGAAGPMESIRTTTDRILEILRNPDFQGEENREKCKQALRTVVDERFDWESFARSALARQWRELNADRKKEFTRLFSRLLERTYLEKLEEHSIEELKDILYLEEEIQGERARVRVDIISANDQEIPVEYRMKKNSNAWLVYDIKAEGVSLVRNYRSQFNDILSKSSYEELVDRLRAKVEDLQ